MKAKKTLNIFLLLSIFVALLSCTGQHASKAQSNKKVLWGYVTLGIVIFSTLIKPKKATDYNIKKQRALAMQNLRQRRICLLFIHRRG
jgi:hypothetical protein